MDILVIGGTLFIGRHLTAALRAEGHNVAVLHRNPATPLPDGVEGLIAHRNDAKSVDSALLNRRFDAVFDNVYDWERGTDAGQVAATARACAGDRLRRYVFMSSVAAYPPGLDRVESDPLTPATDPNPYARNKAESERALFRMHRHDGFPAVTLRPPFVYGPGNPFYREAFFWDRMRGNRPVIVPGDGNRLMQFVYVHDLVWCCLRVLDLPAAVGQAFNVAHLHPVTQRQAVGAFAKAACADPRIVHIPREDALAAGGDTMGPKLYFGLYYDLPSITMNVGKAGDVLEFAPTSFDEGLRRTYEWWLKNNSFPAPDYAFEDELLSIRPL